MNLECIIILILIICFIFLNINYIYFLYLTLAVYLFYLIITVISILLDDRLYKNYANIREIITLLFMAMIEPIFYHPVNVYASLKGYLHFILQKEQSWGNMQRIGFNTTKK